MQPNKRLEFLPLLLMVDIDLNSICEGSVPRFGLIKPFAAARSETLNKVLATLIHCLKWITCDGSHGFGFAERRRRPIRISLESIRAVPQIGEYFLRCSMWLQIT